MLILVLIFCFISTTQDERVQLGECLMSNTISSDDRRFMTLVVKVQDRETVQECLDVVLEKLQSLQAEEN